MNASNPTVSNRLLVIDDNPAIHGDFRKILTPPKVADESLQAAEKILFGEAEPVAPPAGMVYELDSAFQGQEGLALVEQALAEGRPYALAFVDVRMPPGWDGVETISRIWEKSPDLPVVICTAFSDYSWSEMMARLGHSDNLVILRKPFEPIEVLQLAHSLVHKWQQSRQIQAHIRELDALVAARTHKLAEANEALRRSEDRFSKAFHANPVPLLLLNSPTQRWVDVNRSLLELIGFQREAMVGRKLGEITLFAEPALAREITEELLSGRPVQHRQAEISLPTGKNLTVLVSAEIFELEQQRHVLLSVQDITLRVKMENQLREAQKMEVVGQIAAGVAHDFNNILTVIQGHAELHLASGTLDLPLEESFREISTASTRAALLVRQLLAFSRKQMLNRRRLEVVEMLHEFAPTLGKILNDNTQLEINCAANVPPVFADAVNFEQIFINLVLNARDAMPEGGRLSITAEPMVCDAKYKEQVPDALLGEFVRFSVVDQGCGMSEEVRRKVFEPFFTTKDIGQGTGLGLSTVYGIVKQHQGWVEVESQPGVGSVFRFYLPVAGHSMYSSRMQ